MEPSTFIFIGAFLIWGFNGVVQAAVAWVTSVFNIQAGDPFKLQWSGNNGPVNITLMNGPDEDLKPVLVIDTDNSGTSFIWTPPSTLPADTYELHIQDSDSDDYSPRFKYPAAGSSSESTGGSPQATTSSVMGSTAPPVSSPSAPATSTATSSPVPTQSITGSEDTGLSTGARAGIGAGAGVGGIVLLAILGFLIYRQGKAAGRRAEPSGPISPDPNEMVDNIPTYQPEPSQPKPYQPEADVSPKLETGGQKETFQAWELDATPNMSELPATNNN